jgi:hypothetical protein
MQRGTNHTEQSNDKNGRKSARNKTMRRGTNHTEQKNKGNRRKSVREQNHVCGNKSAKQRNKRNEGNVRFFVQNSPTSEADQIFDQFISPPRPKHCTKS